MELDKLDLLYQAMIAYDAGDPARIQHFVKVNSFSRLIGRMENLDRETLLILEAAAYVHDIGIRPAMEKYGNCNGKHQEELGPEPARKLLGQCGFSEKETERAAYLVGHHHTYDLIDGMDYQILVEADFLVNLYEDQSPDPAVKNAYDRIFRTRSGKEICRKMFGLEEEKMGRGTE